jgi:hypothetical protein
MEAPGVESVARQCNTGTGGADGVARVEVALAALPQERDTLLQQLFLLNVLLQVFDGVATYGGLQHGFREANPLLRSAIHHWGVVPTLLIFKTSAYGLLVLVYRIASPHLATPALGALAAIYAACSLIPWLGMLLFLLSCSF